MTELRILYFRESVLERSEVLDTQNIFQALSVASQHHPELTAEIWSEQGRMAVVKPTLGNRSGSGRGRKD